VLAQTLAAGPCGGSDICLRLERQAAQQKVFRQQLQGCMQGSLRARLGAWRS
jgi:hypothetical protein